MSELYDQRIRMSAYEGRVMVEIRTTSEEPAGDSAAAFDRGYDGGGFTLADLVGALSEDATVQVSIQRAGELHYKVLDGLADLLAPAGDLSVVFEDDLTALDDLDYCAGCGQIGCTRDARDHEGIGLI
jgi:hypothetical protein